VKYIHFKQLPIFREGIKILNPLLPESSLRPWNLPERQERIGCSIRAESLSFHPGAPLFAYSRDTQHERGRHESIKSHKYPRGVL